MKRIVSRLTAAALIINAIAAVGFLYQWGDNAIHEWHMSYYDRMHYPLVVRETHYKNAAFRNYT